MSNLNENTQNNPVNPDSTVTLQYLLGQMEAIRSQTQYLENALEKLAEMPNGENGMAIGQIIEQREKTNRQLLSMYQEMYQDFIAPSSSPNKDRVLDLMEKIVNNEKMSREEKDMLLSRMNQMVEW